MALLPEDERRLTLSVLKASIEALGSVVTQNTEILLHDLDHPNGPSLPSSMATSPAGRWEALSWLYRSRIKA